MIEGLLTSMVVSLASGRRSLVGATLHRVPTLQAILANIPVKTFACLSCTGVMSVIFATLPRMTARTFGGCCGSIGVLFFTLGLRVYADEEVVATRAAGVVRGGRKREPPGVVRPQGSFAPRGRSVGPWPSFLGVPEFLSSRLV